MTEWSDFEWYDPESDKDGFEQFNDHMKRDHGFIEVEPPTDAGTIVIFPDADGKIDMIDAVNTLYGVKRNKGDRVDLKSPHAAMALYHAAAKRLLAVIVEMDSVRKMTETERKKADVEKQKRYLEKNREKVNARRRAHYQKNKERINAKRKEQYALKLNPDI